MLYGNILIGVGAVGLLSSLLTMKWFFVIPVATYQSKTVESGYLMPSLFSDPISYLNIWAFLVFNLDEMQAGILGDEDFGFYTAADWGSYKWGGLPPSITGQTADQLGASYGPLGSWGGYGSLALIGAGVVMNLVL